MKITLLIKVEDRHYSGAGHSGNDCPLAKAIRESAGTRAHNVGSGGFDLNGFRLGLPSAAGKIVTEWDTHNRRQYLDFEVELPESSAHLLGY